jgi:hypothetical protein
MVGPPLPSESPAKAVALPAAFIAPSAIADCLVLAPRVFLETARLRGRLRRLGFHRIAAARADRIAFASVAVGELKKIRHARGRDGGIG